ncbi:MAG TPA: hypothetical protein PKM88_11340 [bacterium]|mgnify:CR=1 FL=1|nr:hypothetical protein [bacterium]
MRVLVAARADGSYAAWPRGYREWQAVGGDYNDALEQLRQRLLLARRDGTLPAELLPIADRPPRLASGK